MGRERERKRERKRGRRYLETKKREINISIGHIQSTWYPSHTTRDAAQHEAVRNARACRKITGRLSFGKRKNKNRKNVCSSCLLSESIDRAQPRPQWPTCGVLPIRDAEICLRISRHRCPCKPTGGARNKTFSCRAVREVSAPSTKRKHKTNMCALWVPYSSSLLPRLLRIHRDLTGQAGSLFRDAVGREGEDMAPAPGFPRLAGSPA